MAFTVVAVDIKAIATSALSNVVVLRVVDESTSVTDSVVLATVPTETITGVMVLVVGGEATSVLGSLVDSREAVVALVLVVVVLPETTLSETGTVVVLTAG